MGGTIAAIEKKIQAALTKKKEEEAAAAAAASAATSPAEAASPVSGDGTGLTASSSLKSSVKNVFETMGDILEPAAETLKKISPANISDSFPETAFSVTSALKKATGTSTGSEVSSADSANPILAQMAKQAAEKRKKQAMMGPDWRKGIRRGSQTLMGSAGLSAGR